MSILERFSLKGRVALVTAGAGPLFGSSISEALAEAGATLITASRSPEGNEAFCERLRSEGFDAHPMQCDIKSPESIRKLHDDVIAKFGRLDVLVNSALARDGHAGSLEDETDDVLMNSAQGDYVGLFEICRAFLPDMTQQNRGSIINISSIYGVVANDPGLYAGTGMKQPPSYNFVKAGMINYTRYLASYYGRQGVRANCISPGGYFNSQPESFVEAYESRVPLGRMMSNDDLKGAVVFLASDASNYVTGQNLLVDGGWTIV
jgi:NAD(P)-dependent dehydrogenase (short-subunit alcohol dehydrogenase family)